MDVTSKDAAALANQAKRTLLERLRKGGTDMPSPNPDLTSAEVTLAIRVPAAACRHPRGRERASSRGRTAIACRRAYR